MLNQPTSSPMMTRILGFLADSCASAGPEDPGEAAKRIEASTPLNRPWKIGRPGGCRRGLALAGSYIATSFGALSLPVNGAQAILETDALGSKTKKPPYSSELRRTRSIKLEDARIRRFL